MSRSIKKFYQAYSDHTLFIIVCFILFWPFALFLIWKHKKWNLKARSLVTSVLVGFTLLFGAIVYNAPPHISLSDEAALTNYKTDNNFMMVAGQVSTLHNPKLRINDESVKFNEYGDFRHKLPLAEGKTSVRIVVKSDKGVVTKQYKVHRTTTAELIERKAQAEKVAADKKRIAEDKAAEKKRTAEKVAADKKKTAEARALKIKQKTVNAMPTCDGIKIKSSCKAEGVVYKTYVYYPAVAEKTRTLTDTTYKEEITGYCTLCNDGTYSPSCATGRGACSHHGGVAQWNAPRVRNVPVHTDRVVVDAPAVAEYYERVLDPTFN